MEWIAGLMGVPAASSPELPPDRFHCLLDEQPTHLLPQWAAQIEAPLQQLVINPHCWFAWDGQLPQPDGDPTAALQRPGMQDSLALQGPIAWVHDPVRDYYSPFWFGERLSLRLYGCMPGDAEPAGLSRADRAVLVSAGILSVPNEGDAPPCAVFAGWVGARRKDWAEMVLYSRRTFANDGYVTMRGLIHPFHLAAMRRYYRRLLRLGKVDFIDDGVSRRFGIYNDPVARFFHDQLAGVMTDVAGEPVKPSYVYFGAYPAGTCLRKHIDREQCEFSITMCIDYSPEPEEETDWPIHLVTPRGDLAVYQRLGDALFYRGCQLPHYRDPLPQGRTSTSIFFHYVRQSFSGSLE
jgi:hypothetical protein